MLQLIKDFKWLFVIPLLVVMLSSFLIAGMVIGGQSSSNRLSALNTQLEQAQSELDETRNNLSIAESQLAGVKDNEEELFYKGAWFFCMALTIGERIVDCFNTIITFLMRDYYNTELSGWDWAYVQDVVSNPP